MRAKIISSLEKCFPDETVDRKPCLEYLSILKNERCSFQVCFESDAEAFTRERVRFQVVSELKAHISVYRVRNIPSAFPCYPDNHDENYLRTQPGLYPDLLEPMGLSERLPVRNMLQALWIEIDPQGKVPAGTYPIVGTFVNDNDETVAQVKLELEIIGAELPEQKLIYTQWFYPDCLMQYYGTKMYSQKHWHILEHFMKNARKYGQNMILTPLLSPELDTYIGGYRPATQLVDIAVEKGKYRFGFDKLGKWVDLCDRVGIRYFEINHFFSQWGAAACPQVVATVNGKKKRIFGWDTPSDSEAYKEFLGALIPAFLAFMKSKNGADKRCWFHISDEPKLQNMENYEQASRTLAPLLKGYPVMDALSNYEFYAQKAMDCPVPSVDNIQPFLDHKTENLWTYYCCAQAKDVSNRFFAMPSARNRIIGTQLYKFGIAGFLHWGYNFYNSQFSYGRVDPFLCSDADAYFPSGDAYSVYPGKDGTPWPSMRQVVFYEALQDLRALQLCETLYGKEYTIQLLEEGIEPITFTSYPKDAQYLLNLRRRVNAAIKEKGLKIYGKIQ